MGDANEDELDTVVQIEYDDGLIDDKCQRDATVSKIQTDTDVSVNCNSEKSCFEFSGVVSETCNVSNGSKEGNIIQILKDSVRKTGVTIPSMHFPQLKEKPLNEYEGMNLFVGAFPLLFPGGVGDIYSDEVGE